MRDISSLIDRNAETIKRFLTNESITLSDEDNLLVNACIDYEKSQSQINIGCLLQGANVQTVNINIGNKLYEVLSFVT
jgi:hypothetical protein